MKTINDKLNKTMIHDPRNGTMNILMIMITHQTLARPNQFACCFKKWFENGIQTSLKQHANRFDRSSVWCENRHCQQDQAGHEERVKGKERKVE